jgi:hypothetical protein
MGEMRAGAVDWVRSQERLNWNFIFKFQRILEFGKTLRNSTRRFRRNLDMAMICNLRPN